MAGGYGGRERNRMLTKVEMIKVPTGKIELTWNNNHGAITDKEKEEIEKDWERNKNIRYHYPVRRA